MCGRVEEPPPVVRAKKLTGSSRPMRKITKQRYRSVIRKGGGKQQSNTWRRRKCLSRESRDRRDEGTATLRTRDCEHTSALRSSQWGTPSPGECFLVTQTVTLTAPGTAKGPTTCSRVLTSLPLCLQVRPRGSPASWACNPGGIHTESPGSPIPRLFHRFEESVALR